jgi:ribosomal protein S4
MPDFTRLAAEVDLMRRGLGRRRQELRRRLAAVDGALREERNLEALRVANLKVRVNAVDSRLDNTVLRRALERSTTRLAVLDQRILEAIARQLSP